ncbi:MULTISPECIES: acyltransferase family protein [Pseudomonadaceae]|uniref:Acyltransferase n=1 Tax=Pseudomonas denitrificans TaxID=43306 RepID=A0A9X7N3Z8_PSEDE|nr:MULTISPECIES: acyltransferase [Pseudomonadaceae]MBD9634223.1 acyltransferase [Pseudomonas sp. PDM19]QEY74623.1 acyltransferase [Pseudomonas denitrificans (nom. rej.)]
MKLPDPQPAAGRLLDIEALRAYAIGFVLIHHAFHFFILDNRFVPTDQQGFLVHWFHAHLGLQSGVDLFFAISGFVITRSLWPQLMRCENRQDALRHSLAFWLRRIWRLLPAAWFWLLATLVLTAGFNSSGAFGELKQNAVMGAAAALQLANFHLANAGLLAFNPFAVYWSLSLEEQFYLLLPPILWLGRRQPAMTILALLLLRWWLFPSNVLLVAVTRVEPILLGVLLALLWRPGYLSVLSQRSRRLLAWLLLATLSTLSTLSFLPPAGRSQMMAVGICSVLLVALACQDEGILGSRGPLRAFLQWLGSRSYGLYLIHIPAFALGKELLFRIAAVTDLSAQAQLLWSAVLSTVLLVLFSELSYRKLEMPLRERGRRHADRLIAPPHSPGLQIQHRADA